MSNISNAKIGANFERYVDKCLSINGWDVVRIFDGCKQIDSHRIIRAKQAFDYFATRAGRKAIYFDAKTTEGETFPFSKINPDQVKHLLKLEKNGFVAGFIVHFRQNNTYAFISAKQLASVSKGESIKSKDCVNVGQEIRIDRLFEGEEC